MSVLRLIRTRLFSILTTLLMLSSLFMLSGCWVVSINGINTGSMFHPDPDRIFDGGLLGSWTMKDLTCTVILNVKADGNGYAWEKTAFGEKCADKGKKFYSQAELFQLGNRRFLDVTARQDDVCEMCLPVHWIFQFETDNDSITLMPIDSDWVKKAKANKTTNLATVTGDTNTITASASELKAFCRENAGNRQVFVTVSSLIFKRKYADKP